MSTTPTLYDQYRQSVAALPPPPGLAPLTMPNSAPTMASPSTPNVTQAPTQLDQDKAKLQQTKMAGPGEEQLYHKITGSNFGQNHPILGKILGGAAAGATGLADVGLGTLGGGIGRLAEEMTPGTILNHQVKLGEQTRAIGQDEANAKNEAETANLNAQPELKEQAGELAQAKLDEKTQHDQGTLQASLRAHGYAPDEANPGQIRPLRYDEMSPQQQAVTDLKSSQEELAAAQKAYKDAQTKNIPVQMQQAQQRIETAQLNAQTAIKRLGLSEQALQFHQDEFYNPQPTARERTTGDLAESAVNQVHTIRQIIKERPDLFGPGGEAKQKLAAWLSSNAEDAGQFKAASNYLAEHSAGVFGGRGEYIIRALKDITNPNQDVSALTGALDQAEKTAGHFVQAGQTHGRGGTGHAAEQGQSLGKTEKPDGVYEMNGKQYRVEGGQVYAH